MCNQYTPTSITTNIVISFPFSVYLFGSDKAHIHSRHSPEDNNRKETFTVHIKKGPHFPSKLFDN